MEKLTELYNELESMGVFMFAGSYQMDGGYDAAVVELDGATGLFLDIDRVRTIAQEKAAVGHEWGHIVTGTTHAMNAPPALIQWGEAKATRAQIKKLLPFKELEAAVKSGAVEPWELAEYFFLPESLICQALEYYTVSCGLTFQ